MWKQQNRQQIYNFVQIIICIKYDIMPRWGLIDHDINITQANLSIWDKCI